MRRLGTVLAVLTALAGPALALKAPDPADVALIEKDILRVRTLQGVRPDPQESHHGKKKRDLGTIEGVKAAIKDEEGSIDNLGRSSNTPRMIALQSTLDALQKEQARIAQTVLDATRKAYGIDPARASGDIVVGRYTGVRADWKPSFSEMTMTHTTRDKDGHPITVDAPGPYAGIVWDDGSNFLTVLAFKHSPGYLASIMYHEMIHFEQDTTHGRGDRMSPYDREREAFQAQQSPGNKNYFNLTPEEAKDVDTVKQKELNRIQNSATGYMLGVFGLDPNEPLPSNAPTDDAFLSGLGEIQQLSRDSKKLIGQQQAQDRLVQEQQERDYKRAMAEREARQKAAYDYIKTAVGLACSDPAAFNAQIDEGQVIGVSAELDSLSLSFQVDDAQNEVGWKSLSVKLNACQESLMRKLIEASGPVSPRTISQWAVQYREAHPNLLTRFVTSLRDFKDSLGNLLPSPGTSDGGSDAPSEREPVERQPREGGAERHSPDNWGSLNQLRGIASGL